MTFHTVDFAGGVSSGRTLSDLQKVSKAELTAATEIGSNSSSADENNAMQNADWSQAQQQNDGSGPTSEELRGLLNSRDSYLRQEMDRRDEEHQHEMATIKAEMSKLRRTNNLSGMAAAEQGIETQHYQDDSDMLSSEFLNDVEGAKKEAANMVNGDIVRTPDEDEDDEEEQQGIDLPLLPEDTFSYLAFSRLKSTSMFVAISVVGIQVVTLSVLALDFASTVSPGNRMGVPVSVNTRTATIQVIALGIIVFSQGDLQDSLNLLFMGYDKEELESSIKKPVPYWRWLISLWTRLLVTFYGLIITFVMIIRESDVTQLLLDFTSIEFVTNIDNIFFWLTAWGYLGYGAQKDASRVVLAKSPTLVQQIEEVPRATSRRAKRKKHLHVKKASSKKAGLAHQKSNQTLNGDNVSVYSMESMPDVLLHGKENRSGICCERFPRLLFLLLIYLVMVAGWACVYYWQRTGSYVCETVYTQFNDIYNPGLATFSGLYDVKCGDNGSCKRAEYVERGHGNYSGSGKFFFCDELSSWVFAFSETGEVTCGNWTAKSAKQNELAESSYNILESIHGNEGWSVALDERSSLPLPTFTLECFDCRFDDDFCGGDGRGRCVNNKCVCDEGWYGYRCEFFRPCDDLEVNPLNNNGGSRTWAGKYQYMEVFPDPEVEFRGNEIMPDGLVLKYNRPVYKGGGNGQPVEIIFYNGRRWVNVVLDTEMTEEQVTDFVLNLHAYWTDYTASFLTTSVDVNTPEDSTNPSRLSWLEANPPEANSGRVQGPNVQSDQIDLKLLCASCDTEKNPCLYGGTCTATSTCICLQGDEGGTLCQIPPSGNGKCDFYFNTPRFNYDGGDCCENTCVSTVQHECGVDQISSSLGVTVEFVGFPNCADPDAAKQISGSQILYRIMERNTVVCGVYTTALLGDFFASQCGAIAGAVLGDPNAYTIDYWGGTAGVNRFLALNEGKFDIVFGSDFTANRDIYEKVSQTAFSYAAMPYYFAGLTFAGIPEFVKCADSLDYISPGCQDVRICTSRLSSWYDVVSSHFPPENVVGTEGITSSVPALEEGLCNVFGATAFEVQLENVIPLGYDPNRPYAVGGRMHTKSFETWMTTSSDRQWTKLVSWIFEALVQAEESGITKTTANQMATTDVFNDFDHKFDDLFRNAVAASGNFGEIWDSTMIFPRPGMNHVCNGTSGLMVAMDLGAFSDNGERPKEGGHIERILQRGALRCSVSGAEGFATFDETANSWSGLEVDICRGISAAIFKGQARVDFVIESIEDTFVGINTGQLDLAMGKTRTLEREVKHARSGGFPFDFTPPYFYDGMIFAGYLPYGRCASELNFLASECQNTTICVPDITTWYNALLALEVPEANIIVTSSLADSLAKHVARECNAIAFESQKVNRTLAESEDYFVGTRKYTKEPLSIMHRSDDQQFSDLLRWIIYGFFYAEENDITSDTPLSMPATNLFGSELTGIWQNSIRESGNYGEMFSRSLSDTVVRDGLNQLNDLSGAQLCASPGTA